MSYKLGDKVTDSLTGFIGTAVSSTEFTNGCKRIGVLPTELKDGLPQETIYVDEKRLREHSPSIVSEPNKWLGKKVTDTITGVTGIVVSISSYLFSQPRVMIVPKGTFEGKLNDEVSCDETQLKEYKPEKVTASGGPNEMAPKLKFASRI
jgi:hypothetical protein